MNDYTAQTRYATFASFLADYVDMLDEEYKHKGNRYTIRYTASGDYVGGYVEESNRKVLLEDCPTIVQEEHYRFDCSAAVIDPEHFAEWDSGELDTLCDHLDSLEGYPVLDDGLLSELEDEAMRSAWEEEKPYVLQAIVERAEDAYDVGYTIDADQLLSDWMEAANGWWCDIIIVEGKSVWVDTDSLVDIIMSDYGDKLESYVVPEPWNDPTQPEFHESGAVGKRAAIYNAKAQAERYRGMGLPSALLDSGEENE